MNVNERIIAPDTSLREALLILKDRELGILLVCDESQKLLGVLTDGDFRRALIRGLGFDTPCQRIMNTQPYVLPLSVDESRAFEILAQEEGSSSVFFVPLLDAEGRVQRVLSRWEVEGWSGLPVHGVIMAGGFGSRLSPMTNDLPKPMLDIGGRPLIEHIVRHLLRFGISKITISTHYLAEKIVEHFGDGTRFNAEIDYVHEDEPLGSAGAIARVEDREESLLVINGDVFTNVDCRALWTYHQRMNADITVAAKQYDIEIPYGVLQTKEDGQVRSLEEKPVQSCQINAGIYLLSKEVKNSLSKGERLEMDSLIKRYVADQGASVYSFIVHEYWIDIGQMKDYERAKRDYPRHRLIGRFGYDGK